MSDADGLTPLSMRWTKSEEMTLWLLVFEKIVADILAGCKICFLGGLFSAKKLAF